MVEKTSGKVETRLVYVHMEWYGGGKLQKKKKGKSKMIYLISRVHL